MQKHFDPVRVIGVRDPVEVVHHRIVLVGTDRPDREVAHRPESPTLIVMDIWSVGHGARPLEELLATVSGADIENVADIHSQPASRRHPHFAADSLKRALGEVGIAYVHIPELGGAVIRTRIRRIARSEWQHSADTPTT